MPIRTLVSIIIDRILVFAFLDAYYLSLERQVRNTYIAFADSLREEASKTTPIALVYSFGSTKTDTYPPGLAGEASKV